MTPSLRGLSLITMFDGARVAACARRRRATGLLWLLLAAGLLACTELEDGGDTFGPAGGAGGVAGSGAAAPMAGEAGEPMAGMAPVSGSGGSGGSVVECPKLEDRTEVRLPEAEGEDIELAEDERWTCDKRYVLQGNVLVGADVTLTIDPGVTVLGEGGALLLVRRGGRLMAEGTEELPIVFTSAKSPGSRASRDWRGVVLTGLAPSQQTNAAVYAALNVNASRAFYGGGPNGSPEASCGALRYVRVEFAGGPLNEEDEPGAALTLAGCGTDTVVDYVQVHGASDGVGLFGGTVPLRHILITSNVAGNALEWTAGYAGSIQFLIAQSLGASTAVLGNNSQPDPEASPTSAPAIYNATIVGSPPLVSGEHRGVRLQWGSYLRMRNSIVQGFVDAAFDLELNQAILENQVGPGKPVDISHILLFGNTNDFSANGSYLEPMPGKRVIDPGLPDAASATEPVFLPVDATVNTDADPAPAPFDATASYRGAVSPDGPDWTRGWTDYPEN